MTSAKAIDQHHLKTISTLLGVISSQRWAVFQIIALNDEKIYHMVSDILVRFKDEFNGMTLLHACCRHEPPLEIIAQMIRLRPELVSAQDRLGRTPLHIAAGCSAHPHVIKLIAHADPATCTVQDEDMRTPLHLACDRYCNLFEDPHSDDSSDGRDPSYDAIRALLSESLQATMLEDEDEMNPLEYAIMSDADIKVVKLLQKATQKAASTTQITKKSTSPQLAVDLSSPLLIFPSKRRAHRRVSLSDSSKSDRSCEMDSSDV